MRDTVTVLQPREGRVLTPCFEDGAMAMVEDMGEDTAVASEGAEEDVEEGGDLIIGEDFVVDFRSNKMYSEFLVLFSLKTKNKVN